MARKCIAVVLALTLGFTSPSAGIPLLIASELPRQHIEYSPAGNPVHVLSIEEAGERTPLPDALRPVRLTQFKTEMQFEAELEEGLRRFYSGPLFPPTPEGSETAAVSGSSAYVVYDADKLPQNVTEFLKQDYALQAEEENAQVNPQSNDPYYFTYGSWGQSFDDMWWHKRVRAEEAWQYTRGEGITVAVLDTGVDYQHPDLNNQIWTNSAELHGAPGVDDDGNGYVDDVRGWDFFYGNPEVLDTGGHGTHVAGIIAGEADNNQGIAGIAPGSRILPVQVLSSGGYGFFEDVVAGIRYAADMGARVINMSLSGVLGIGSFLYQQMLDAILYAKAKGAVIVAAAGNDADDMRLNFPAAYDEVIAVGAVTASNVRAWFSNYGDVLDVVAPGSDVLSLRSLYTHFGNDFPPDANYSLASGTSMATPVVAGIVALMLSRDPLMTSEDVMRRLKYSAKDLGAAGRDNFYGYGLVDAFRALAYDFYETGEIKTYWPAEAGEDGLIRQDYARTGELVRNSYSDGSYSVYEYWPGTGLLKQTAHYDSTGALEKTVTYYEDGSTWQEIYPDGKIDEYDSEGNLVSLDVKVKREKITKSRGRMTSFEDWVYDDNGNRLYKLKRSGIRYSRSGEVIGYTEIFTFPSRTRLRGVFRGGVYTLTGNAYLPAGRTSILQKHNMSAEDRFLLDPSLWNVERRGAYLLSGLGTRTTVGDYDVIRYKTLEDRKGNVTGFEEHIYSKDGEFLYALRRSGIRRGRLSGEVISYTDIFRLPNRRALRGTFRGNLYKLSGTAYLAGGRQSVLHSHALGASERFMLDPARTQTQRQDGVLFSGLGELTQMGGFSVIRYRTVKDRRGNVTGFQERVYAGDGTFLYSVRRSGIRRGRVSGEVISYTDTFRLANRSALRGLFRRGVYKLSGTAYLAGGRQSVLHSHALGASERFMLDPARTQTQRQEGILFSGLGELTQMGGFSVIRYRTVKDRRGHVTGFQERVYADDGTFLYSVRRSGIRRGRVSGEVISYTDTFRLANRSALRGLFRRGVYKLSGTAYLAGGRQSVLRSHEIRANERFILDPSRTKTLREDNILLSGLGEKYQIGEFSSVRYKTVKDRRGNITAFEERVFDESGNFLYTLTRTGIRRSKVSNHVQQYSERIAFANGRKVSSKYSDRWGFRVAGRLSDNAAVKFLIPTTDPAARLLYSSLESLFALILGSDSELYSPSGTYLRTQAL